MRLHRRRSLSLCAGLVLGLAPAAKAEETGGDVVVEDEAPRTTGSERTLDRQDVVAQPGTDAGDLLRAMPGLHLSAHGGRGKADQIFLRGFDAVHGGDLAVDVEGVPLNEVSNTHAHGYLDLHLVPPALVRGLALRPGVWGADAGDFAMAGSASYRLGLEAPGLQARVGGGTDRSGQATLAWRPAEGAAGTFVLADADIGAGVGQARGWRQLRAGGGIEGAVGAARGRVWVLGYDGAFESPGVLREDDLEAGRVGFWDAYPGSGGGRSRRGLAAARLSGGDAERVWSAQAWGGARDLSLTQNFTGFYSHPDRSDGTEQSYTAVSAGAGARGWRRLSAPLAVEGGASARVDHVTQAESRVEPSGAVWQDLGGQSATQADGAAWAAVAWTPTPWLLVRPGLRGAVFAVAGAWQPVLAPRLAATLFPESVVTGFLAAGRGVRSADVRTVASGALPVATADSAEVGLSTTPAPWLELRAAGFGTLVSDEVVFDHVTARYIPTGPTRRAGVDAGASARPGATTRVDLDVVYADGRYTDTGEPIPYAPRLLGVLGLYADAVPVGGATVTSGLRVQGLGPRPLTGGFKSTPSVVLDLTSTLAWPRWTVDLDVDNLLGSRWRDGEFIYASHWDRDAPRSELPVRHITAGAPFAARVALTRTF